MSWANMMNFLWMTLLLFSCCLQAELVSKPMMQHHQKVTYNVVYDNHGQPMRIELWSYQLQVPVIDDCAWWPDATGYALHAWYDLGGKQNQQQKNSSNLPSKKEIQNSVPSQLQKKSFHIQKPNIEIVSPEVPESVSIVYGDQTTQAAGCYVRVRTNSGNQFSGGVSSMSDKDFAHWWLAGLAYKKYCRMKYHMTPEQKDKLMSAWLYKNFTNQLLADDTLADEVVLELWQEFCDSKSWPFGDDRRECFDEIKTTLKARQDHRKQSALQSLETACREKAEQIRSEIDRKNRELEQAQEIARMQTVAEKYQPEMLHGSDYVSPYQQQREEALQQTIDQKYQQKTKSHELDAQTAGMLRVEGIDHRQFYDLAGTVFQHQLFGEVAEHYQNVAKIMFEYSIKNSCMVPHILEFAQATFDAATMEKLGLAVQLSDVAQLLAETSLSICKGPIQSLCCLAEDLWHTKKTAKRLGQALVPVLRTMGGALAVYDHESSVCVNNMHAAQQVFGGDMQAFNQMCDLSKHAFLHEYEHSSSQDKVQAVSKVVSDIVLQPFLIGKAGKACWGLLSQARELQVLEGLTCLSEELGFAEIAQDLAQIASKEESLITTVGDIEASMGSLVEAEIYSIKKPTSFVDVICEQSFIENVKQLQSSNAFYKNTPLQKQAISFFDRYFYQKELLEFCADVEKTHGVMMVEYLGKEVEMVCNPRHMMTYQLDFRNIASLGQAEGLIGGGHVGLYVDNIVSKGLMKIVTDGQLFGGCRALEIEFVFGTKIAEKTLWPNHWTAEQIMNAIKTAWHQPIFFKTTTKNDKIFLRVVGIETSGIKIEMFLNKLPDGNLKLKTAYPYWEEKAGLNL